MDDELELFWADLLSEESDRVIAAWITLEDAEQATVLDHLRRMVSEAGYAESQATAAQTALHIIETEDADDDF